MKPIIAVMFFSIVLFGCAKYKYSAHDIVSNVELNNVYEDYCGAQAPYMEDLYTGNGSISNHNNFVVYIEQQRILRRNTIPIDTFILKPNRTRNFFFTGGDRFKLTTENGQPLGMLSASPIKGDKVN